MFSTNRLFRRAPAGVLAGGLFSVHAQQAGGTGIPWWVWLIVVLLILAVAIWWFTSRRPAGEAYQAPASMAEPEPPAPSTEPDDLTVIEGIGPKIAGLLQNAGITTFDELAGSDPARLKALLDEAGLQMADPSSWPEQARLAAAGDWDALKSLQDRLKGGRQA